MALRLKNLLAALLCLLFAAGAAACGREPAEGIGEYTCVRVWALGRQFDAEELAPGGFTLLLGSGGRGVLTAGDESGQVDWSLDNGRFRLWAGGSLSQGTLEDGVLTLNLMGSGTVAAFVAPGVELPEPERLPELENLPENWQGWWEADAASGSCSPMSGSLYPCAARLLPAGEGARLLLWDDDSSQQTPVAWAEMEPDGEGGLVNSSGFFMGCWLEPGSWRLTESGCRFEGHFAGDEGEFDFTVFLRPAE